VVVSAEQMDTPRAEGGFVREDARRKLSPPVKPADFISALVDAEPDEQKEMLAARLGPLVEVRFKALLVEYPILLLLAPMSHAIYVFFR
jgi:hypothetical protein